MPGIREHLCCPRGQVTDPSVAVQVLRLVRMGRGEPSTAGASPTTSGNCVKVGDLDGGDTVGFAECAFQESRSFGMAALVAKR
ncbi:hypothetical protein [Phytomonospora endophytica]|uniref:Uncharacterized protein n=1 Tax=Phytomonospora endophytica TaxID=714109 RepID=A0A841FJY5_9ACTN|nr:hypothetical protein [Phytomonospora endophytica]MBB6035253.1 hypothetical protein [Phytomonospora endophytica]